MSQLLLRRPMARALAFAVMLSATAPAAAQVPELGAITQFGCQNEQTAKVTAPANLRYVSDPQRRKANYAKAVASAKSSNPALAEMYQALATQVDLYTIINDYLGKYGMRADDLGDVLALSWFSAYQVANGGKTDDPTKAQLMAIRAQLGAVSVDLAKLSDADKQAMADALMLDMAVQQGALESAKESSPKLVPQLSKTFAEVNLQTFNVDFAQLTLGPKGFVPKTVAKPAVAAKAPAKATPNRPAATTFTAEHSNKILGVRYKSDLIYMFGGPAGYLNRTESTSVLFKDGTACWNCLSEFIEDPSLRVYRREYPNNVGTWAKKGQTYYVTYPDSNGEPSEIEADELLGPAPKGTTYRGTYRSSGGMTVGGIENYTTTSWSEDLRMDKSGRFSWAKDSGFFGGSGGIGFAGSNSSPESSGAYTIDGYTIKFAFDNGIVETKSFVYFENEADIFIIDGSAYWIPSD